MKARLPPEHAISRMPLNRINRMTGETLAVSQAVGTAIVIQPDLRDVLPGCQGPSSAHRAGATWPSNLLSRQGDSSYHGMDSYDAGRQQQDKFRERTVVARCKRNHRTRAFVDSDGGFQKLMQLTESTLLIGPLFFRAIPWPLSSGALSTQLRGQACERPNGGPGRGEVGLAGP